MLNLMFRFMMAYLKFLILIGVHGRMHEKRSVQILREMDGAMGLGITSDSTDHSRD